MASRATMGVAFDADLGSTAEPGPGRKRPAPSAPAARLPSAAPKPPLPAIPPPSSMPICPLQPTVQRGSAAC
jgi:hypothetical protein